MIFQRCVSTIRVDSSRSAFLGELKSIVLAKVTFHLVLMDGSHGVLGSMSTEEVGAWIFVIVQSVLGILVLDARAWGRVSTRL